MARGKGVTVFSRSAANCRREIATSFRARRVAAVEIVDDGCCDSIDASSAPVERTEDRRHKLRGILGIDAGQRAYPIADAAAGEWWVRIRPVKGRRRFGRIEQRCLQLAAVQLPLVLIVFLKSKEAPSLGSSAAQAVEREYRSNRSRRRASASQAATERRGLIRQAPDRRIGPCTDSSPYFSRYFLERRRLAAAARVVTDWKGRCRRAETASPQHRGRYRRRSACGRILGLADGNRSRLIGGVALRGTSRVGVTLGNVGVVMLRKKVRPTCIDRVPLKTFQISIRLFDIITFQVRHSSTDLCPLPWYSGPAGYGSQDAGCATDKRRSDRAHRNSPPRVPLQILRTALAGYRHLRLCPCRSHGARRIFRINLVHAVSSDIGCEGPGLLPWCAGWCRNDEVNV